MKESLEQFIHCEVNTRNDKKSYYYIVIYAQNKLFSWRKLWIYINQLDNYIQGPWMIIGDFNNVLNVKDRIDGNLVQEIKFKDLECMIKTIRLYEHDTT